MTIRKYHLDAFFLRKKVTEPAAAMLKLVNFKKL